MSPPPPPNPWDIDPMGDDDLDSIPGSPSLTPVVAKQGRTVPEPIDITIEQYLIDRWQLGLLREWESLCSCPRCGQAWVCDSVWEQCHCYQAHAWVCHTWNEDYIAHLRERRYRCERRHTPPGLPEDWVGKWNLGRTTLMRLHYLTRKLGGIRERVASGEATMEDFLRETAETTSMMTISLERLEALNYETPE